MFYSKLLLLLFLIGCGGQTHYRYINDTESKYEFEQAKAQLEILYETNKQLTLERNRLKVELNNCQGKE